MLGKAVIFFGIAFLGTDARYLVAQVPAPARSNSNSRCLR